MEAEEGHAGSRRGAHKGEPALAPRPGSPFPAEAVPVSHSSRTLENRFCWEEEHLLEQEAGIRTACWRRAVGKRAAQRLIRAVLDTYSPQAACERCIREGCQTPLLEEGPPGHLMGQPAGREAP